MTDDELDQGLVDFNLQYLSAQSAVDKIESQISQLRALPAGSTLSRTGGPGGVHANGRTAPGSLSMKILLEQKAGASERLRLVDGAIDGLIQEKLRRDAAKRVPVVAEQLRRATGKVKRHDLLAAGVQKALVMLHSNLVELNKSSDEIYELVREMNPDAKGVASYASEFHPTFKPDRLRFPLAWCLNVGQYGRLAKKPFLPHLKTSDFAQAEAHVGRNLLTELRNELQALQTAEHTESSSDVTLSHFVEDEPSEQEIFQ